MNFKIYELSFSEGIHVGNGKLSEGNIVMYADTIFSALCKEALNIGGEKMLNQLVGFAKDDLFRISDTLPFNRNNSETDYYVPKPMIRIEKSDDSSSDNKKAFKKLKYVNVKKIDEFLTGELDPIKENLRLNGIGKKEIRTMSNIVYEEATKPFPIAVYRFNDNWGLYLIIQYKEDFDIKLMDNLINSLSYSGLGGKRSSGLGGFVVKEISKIPNYFLNKLQDDSNRCTSLSIGLPQNEDLASIIEKSTYSLIKRSGYISSDNYSDTFLKKKDSYVFNSGSVFNKSFTGTIIDVGGSGCHPVYRYLNPIFMEV